MENKMGIIQIFVGLQLLDLLTTLVGFKLGAWHDVGWWQKILREPAQPAPLKLFDPARST
jgi:hypothetical protein